jgi:hypothetical protein
VSTFIPTTIRETPDDMSTWSNRLLGCINRSSFTRRPGRRESEGNFCDRSLPGTSAVLAGAECRTTAPFAFTGACRFGLAACDTDQARAVTAEAHPRGARPRKCRPRRPVACVPGAAIVFNPETGKCKRPGEDRLPVRTCPGNPCGMGTTRSAVVLAEPMTTLSRRQLRKGQCYPRANGRNALRVIF